MRSNMLATTLLAFSAIVHLVLLVIAVAYFRRADLLELPPPAATYVLSLLATVLPFAGFAMSACSSLSTAGSKRLFFSKTFLYIYQLLGLVDGSILSISATFLDSTLLNCVLESYWQRAFMQKDGRTIRAIQDARSCCGFNSINDRAYPFPDRNHGGELCRVTHPDRVRPCGEILREEARMNLRTLVGICVVLLAAKAIAMLMSRMKIFEAVEGHLAWMADDRTEWRQGRIDCANVTDEEAENGSHGPAHPRSEADAT